MTRPTDDLCGAVVVGPLPDLYDSNPLDSGWPGLFEWNLFVSWWNPL